MVEESGESLGRAGGSLGGEMRERESDGETACLIMDSGKKEGPHCRRLSGSLDLACIRGGWLIASGVEG